MVQPLGFCRHSHPGRDRSWGWRGLPRCEMLFCAGNTSETPKIPPQCRQRGGWEWYRAHPVSHSLPQVPPHQLLHQIRPRALCHQHGLPAQRPSAQAAPVPRRAGLWHQQVLRPGVPTAARSTSSGAGDGEGTPEQRKALAGEQGRDVRRAGTALAFSKVPPPQTSSSLGLYLLGEERSVAERYRASSRATCACFLQANLHITMQKAPTRGELLTSGKSHPPTPPLSSYFLFPP